MNDIKETDAMYITIGRSSGHILYSDLEKYLLNSNNHVTTSCLGGRMIKIKNESFLINSLARDILKQNSSPKIRAVLGKLYDLSNKNVKTRTLPLRAAAAFRDGLMWLFGNNVTIFTNDITDDKKTQHNMPRQ